MPLDENQLPERPARRRMTPAQRKSLWRRRTIERLSRVGIVLLACALMAGGVAIAAQALTGESEAEAFLAQSTTLSGSEAEVLSLVSKQRPVYTLTQTENTDVLTEEADWPESEYICLFDLSTGEILAQRSAQERMYPASMTKILTLLVAVENISDSDGTFTMTREIGDFCYENDCSIVGYEVGEVIPIQELFYGCILCSGADACLALAQLAAGSEEAFVALMNEKLEQLGLSDSTHFTNCIGLYDDEHYSTAQDIGLLMHAALANETCREVLTSTYYLTAPTQEHPDGMTLSNLFLRRIGTQDTGAIQVLSGKTGYVQQSGNCAVSYAVTEDGESYVCVTGSASTAWKVVHDHAELYSAYCGTDA
ncbi:MAG: D-alanyl-D-alanine carboxypeptidase [Oscillospiraceae bacterium]|nr:D-alanyl-D-alanine carboxypeptidase [Oscillospiraceae bacterium]